MMAVAEATNPAYVNVAVPETTEPEECVGAVVPKVPATVTVYNLVRWNS